MNSGRTVLKETHLQNIYFLKAFAKDKDEQVHWFASINYKLLSNKKKNHSNSRIRNTNCQSLHSIVGFTITETNNSSMGTLVATLVH
jgi:hypothetical protein